MTRTVRNILFIMFDQLRWDYLSCAGHKTLKTPHIDALAAKGVRFTRAYVQSPICGSSRMSFYTGRYVHSHGAQRNNFPLKVGEQTLGDHLRANGMDAFLVGKTHMEADAEGLRRLGIAPDSIIGARLAECGFDVVVRDDGLWAEGVDGYYDESRSPYNEYLKARGYPGDNPWNEYANSGVTDDGKMASGWLSQFARYEANVREEDSETPWLTGRCIDFLEDDGRDAQPWLCHLSYIKPHWPYIVPAPYAHMYAEADVQPANRDPRERIDPHPVYAAYMDTLVARGQSRDDARANVIPAYMALIKQCDDQMGRLFAHLEKTGRMEDTMIVLTSDHGDYLGDHWLGEKNFFHEQAVKIPMIVYDPREEADATRGTTCDALVEAIDLAPTFMEATGAKVPGHILEGRALTPFLHGTTPEKWRDHVICEFDYSTTPMADKLGLAHRAARAFMVFDGRWKMIHFEGGFRPMLFDLETDPDEFVDRGEDPACATEIDRLYERLGAWARRLSQRTAISDETLDKLKGKSGRRGVLLGLYDGTELPEELTVKLKPHPVSDFRPRKAAE
ncbi:sulfatase-like hydrolase/transferase [Mesorhizobium xinjiangense]|uniref:sulfatase-like hydrolase/transferase n=1 Tax=Mesorhizobium xinjiangense TaxID=2678685 RepID=UPI0012EDAAA0|nr:sulfatase-like hydrolase/transferase [Mesorhizobium xinjiangense]